MYLISNNDLSTGYTLVGIYYMPTLFVLYMLNKYFAFENIVFNLQLVVVFMSSNNNTTDKDIRDLGAEVKFIRVRRITGYLAALDNFNNGKKAELHDRVSHVSLGNSTTSK